MAVRCRNCITLGVVVLPPGRKRDPAMGATSVTAMFSNITAVGALPVTESRNGVLEPVCRTAEGSSGRYRSPKKSSRPWRSLDAGQRLHFDGPIRQRRSDLPLLPLRPQANLQGIEWRYVTTTEVDDRIIGLAPHDVESALERDGYLVHSHPVERHALISRRHQLCPSSSAGPVRALN